MKNQRKMTPARAYELQTQCLEDLDHARACGHKGWIETLTKRLAVLNKLALVEPDKETK